MLRNSTPKLSGRKRTPNSWARSGTWPRSCWGGWTRNDQPFATRMGKALWSKPRWHVKHMGETSNPETQCPAQPPVFEGPEIYSRLVRDRSISHGAFRLWHLLRDHANGYGLAWPGQRLIAKSLGCDKASIKGWTTELEEGGYILGIRRIGQRHSFEYRLPVVAGKPIPREKSR